MPLSVYSAFSVDIHDFKQAFPSLEVRVVDTVLTGSFAK